jgi:hypothetical protein
MHWFFIYILEFLCGTGFYALLGWTGIFVVLTLGKYHNMEQMKINPVDQVFIDYESETIPQSVYVFRPVVYEDGNAYCCILGPDREAGVFGSGTTPKDAMEDWEKHVRELIAGPKKKNSSTAQYIINNYKYF